ncbi:FKBP-type peptidyl-prolyl cis-trans isomerase [Celerinatantimonas yamalensis]|uniref:Peptidyl-prolyl cis-trans isomerase n=1 Tax=Celerinatantimonas yamalensis TaxID=559956 RepID=A0ABW9GCR6_9GAMM
MKKYFAVSLLAASMCTFVSQVNAAEKVQLKTEAQKQAYVLGASMSRYVDQVLKQQEKLGLKLERSYVIAGMQDGLTDKIQLSDKQMQSTLQGLKKQLIKLSEAKAEKAAAKNKADGEKFLVDNAKKAGVKTTKSGLEYKVLKKGSGPRPSADDIVTVNYKGTLVNGTEFDSSYKRGKPVTFKLDQVIPGWTEGVQLMHEGAKYAFYIPAKLAYGSQANGQIPADSTLIFDVELLKVKHPQKQAEKAKQADKTAPKAAPKAN